MTVYIILTVAGSNTGPFNLYSDVDGYVSPFESSVSKSDLLAGYTSTLVPLGTSIIRVSSQGDCDNYIDISIVTTTTSTTSTSSTTTTINCQFLLIDVLNADLDDSTGNTFYPNHTLYVEFHNCSNILTINTFDVADVSSPTSDCWNSGSGVGLYYYKDDVQTTASASSYYSGGPC